MVMKVDGDWNKIINSCCSDFKSLFSYGYFSWDEEKEAFYFENEEDTPLKFYFENEEDTPLKYCMFCGKKINATNK